MSILGNFKKIAWHVIKFLREPFIFLFSSLIFLLFYLMKPLVKISVGKLEYNRIGELGPSIELYLRRQSQQKSNKKELHIFVSKKPANRQLLTMIKRRVFVLEGKIPWKLCEGMKTYLRNSGMTIDLPFETNEYHEFSNISPQLSFTKQEEIYGKQLLNKMGIKDGVSFICFHARDKAYLDITHSHRSRQDWSYHDFRDCDINNYLQAVAYIASKGIYALRMGAIVENKLKANNHYILDYASNFRSDFGDIYLSAKCKFFLSSTAGLHMVPTIFNVPVALANAVPLGDMGTSKNDIFIPKKLWLKEEKRFLRFREIMDIGVDWWLQGQLYAQAGIEVIENSKDEILALAKEMNERIDGVWVAKDEDEELQQRFRALFPLGHRCHGVLSRIGAEFLRSNQELLR